MKNLQQRINYQGDLLPLLEAACRDFDMGEYRSHTVIPMGYEDFNLRLETEKDIYLVKIFASFRDEKNCKRYVEAIHQALGAGVAHPLLYQSSQGFLDTITLGGKTDRFCVMEYIRGKSFFEIEKSPDQNEMRFLINQIVLINNISFAPDYIYDNWAIVNFLEQYQKKSEHLSKEDDDLIASLVPAFKKMSLNDLPHCFVHGDITKTNTLLTDEGKIKIIDFAVSNYYPRIIELAALFSDIFFNKQDLQSFPQMYDFVISEYQKHIPLQEKELELLPLFVKLTHAMHILLANYELKILKNISNENIYYFQNGKIGLQYTQALWR